MLIQVGGTVNRLLAEAYYQTGDYTNAINHFEIYIDQQEDVSSMDYFYGIFLL